MTLTADNNAGPVAIERSDVEAARTRIAGLARRTPIFRSALPKPQGEVPVLFKLEYLQHGGSFKCAAVSMQWNERSPTAPCPMPAW